MLVFVNTVVVLLLIKSVAACECSSVWVNHVNFVAF